MARFQKGQVPWNKCKKGLQVAWNKGMFYERPNGRRQVEKKCVRCALTFTVQRFREKTAKYCSQQCRYGGIFKNCTYCGKEFRVYDSLKRQKTCSLSCRNRVKTPSQHPYWKGGISKDNRHYRTIRRTRELGAEGYHSTEDWLALKIKYGFMCLCCKKTEPEIILTEDHIVPLSKGGTDYIENIQPLCKSCNSIKHTKTINYLWQKQI